MVRKIMTLSEMLNNVDEAKVIDFDGEYLGKVSGAAAYFKCSILEFLSCPVIDVKFPKGTPEIMILSTCKVKREV